MSMPERESFCAVLAHGPLLQSDAIVVLCGEDGSARLATGIQLMQSGAAPIIVLSGGLDRPPRCQSAASLYPLVMAKGVSPDRIIIEGASQNTHQQAVNVVELAMTNGWTRLLVVASPYHAPRAFLTFVQAMREANCNETMRIVNVPAAELPWWAPPAGCASTRLELIATEFEKIDEYWELGHCASYEHGIEYLRWWEGR